MRDPPFWWTERSAVATMLAPLGVCYGAIAAWRMARSGRKAPVPVICVGNFTMGGAGKTPSAIAFARLLLMSGHSPFFLSRGYGGQVAGPVRVDDQHAVDVGDEPLLLCRVAPTIVARDRPAGALAAAEAGADVIVMDDGLQNPSLAKDLAVAVVDGRRGIGNGRIFPAGPLRAQEAPKKAPGPAPSPSEAVLEQWNDIGRKPGDQLLHVTGQNGSSHPAIAWVADVNAML